ncbi:Tyrosine kinase [Thalictrum thalictroides]|uniref:Tyrosine kinase n=1 Tax=Thalictrum thalictroides TaxID=46969 RepID=A0A7J6W7T8_THATH|nr:Tyrosine kinase [Thalictrum thalictroides]
MLNVERDRQQKKLISPKQSPLAQSPGFSPKPSPLRRSPVVSPKPLPLKKSPVVGVLSPKKQEKPGKPIICCGGCLGTRSPPSLAQTQHQTINNYQLGLVTYGFVEFKNYYIHITNRSLFFPSGELFYRKLYSTSGPRLSSPSLLSSPNLAAIVSQARIKRWHIDPDEIELHEQVGRGSTAIIYRGSWKGLEVAVKCMNPDFFYFTENGVGFFVQEIETLSRQHHPFVLRLVGACLNPPEHGWVVTEFLSMTLKEWLHGKGNKRTKRSIPLPPLKEILAKALEISQGMQYLHEQKPMLLHRDLKPSNIFMDSALHIRVADFGHARFLSDGEKALTGETGTYIYMAPEVIRHEPYNEKCDVFSYGVILNELITGEHPYIETTYGPTEIALGVSEAKLRPALPADDSQHGELIDLICQSWDEDTSKRPSFAIITSTLKSIQERLIT